MSYWTYEFTQSSRTSSNAPIGVRIGEATIMGDKCTELYCCYGSRKTFSVLIVESEGAADTIRSYVRTQLGAYYPSGEVNECYEFYLAAYLAYLLTNGGRA